MTPLVRSNVDITDETGQTHQRVAIHLRAGSNVARIVNRQGRTVHELAGAGDFTRPTAKSWVVPFDGGGEWRVVSRGGCGCGGRG